MLDEAVMVRDLIRGIQGEVTNVLPDPGNVSNSTSDIGEVCFYEVTGVTTGGSVYGTGIYTTDSHLGMAAVHSGRPLVVVEDRSLALRAEQSAIDAQLREPSYEQSSVFGLCFDASNRNISSPSGGRPISREHGRPLCAMF